MRENAKALVALVGIAIAAVAQVLGNGTFGSLDTGDYLYVIGAIVGSGALVYLGENVPGVLGGAIKALVAGGGAAVTLLATAYAGDAVISQGEYLTAAAGAIAVLVGTYQVDNGPPPTA